jgi:hypothetical protein
MSELGIETVGQLAATPQPRLEAAFGDKDAAWLASLARGISGRFAERHDISYVSRPSLTLLSSFDEGKSGKSLFEQSLPAAPSFRHMRPFCADDAVEERRLPKSISCGKTFRGRHSLRDAAALHKWLLELGEGASLVCLLSVTAALGFTLLDLMYGSQPSRNVAGSTASRADGPAATRCLAFLLLLGPRRSAAGLRSVVRHMTAYTCS